MLRILILVLLSSDLTKCVIETPIVNTSDGPIVGSIVRYKDQNIYHFYGIPYAQAPVGRLRFMKPSPVKVREKVYTTNQIKPQCMHFNLYLRYVHTPLSEDCLYLNILVTEKTFTNATRRPVMFWIHGGGFNYNSGTIFPFLSDVLVANQDVILVTINYRLDLFGFLYHDKIPKFIGNQGIWDQNMALRWTKTNIAAFGGDPNSITVFGQSAGGVSTIMHMASPYASGLFSRAIVQSAAPLLINERPNQRVSLSTEIVLQRSGCDRVANKLECLQAIPAEKLLFFVPSRALAFSAIYGDQYLPTSQDNLFLNNSYLNDVPLLFGRTRGDSSPLLSDIVYQLFSTPKLTYNDALKMIGQLFKPEAVQQVARWYVGESGEKLSSQQIQSGIIALNDDLVFGGEFEIARRFTLRQRIGSTNAYILVQDPKVSLEPVCTLDKEYGVCHEDDLIFIFGQPVGNPKAYSQDDQEMSRLMMKIWTEFAETG